jgi:photosynthetic reaction center cytochrome c subunit
MRVARIFFVLLLVIAIGILTIAATPRSSQSSLKSKEPAKIQGFFPNVPTGSTRCMFCHAAEVEGYERTTMAHSLRRASNEPVGAVNANGSKITMHTTPEGYFQSWENAGDKTDYRINYVIGSGTHASGYLLSLGGHLFQSPVAYYASRQSYDLAPGYENQTDPDFTRPVSEECLLCHSGSNLHVSGTLNEYRAPVFSEEAITCERCHGPSEKHLADPRAETIVNPARLEPAARDSVCEQCHLFGVARVANPGKKLSDFVAGQKIEDTFTIYHDANPSGAFKVISHAEQLALSACARKSAGRLWCGTCHNPHDKPAQPVGYYRSRCLTCHTSGFEASHPARDGDCLSCHMPRRSAKDGGHTAFTDHRIQRRPENRPDAPVDSDIVAWREPSPELRERNRGIAHVEVGMQRHSPSFIAMGYRDLTGVQQQFANDPDFFRWIGEALLSGRQTSEAKFAFDRALQLNPNSALAESRDAAPYIQEGDAANAITHLQHAIELDPLDLVNATTLIGLYRKQGRETDSAALSAQIKTALGTTDMSATDAESAKKSEEVFKNIQALKATPADQIIPAMQFISSSLGVQCTFCHVEGHLEKDDKKPKQIARDMMRMMYSINQSNFAGQREITCYSCHRGIARPAANPAIGAENLTKKQDLETAMASALPTVASVLQNYMQASGGEAAMEKIISRQETATAQFAGDSANVKILTQAGKQTVTYHFSHGDSISIFDGRAGWIGYSGSVPHEMNKAQLAAAAMDADLQFPLHIQQIFPELCAQYPEKIGDREVYVLLGSEPGQPPAKIYFDEQSGLLVRVVRFSDSPLGLNPTQTDYSDYRSIDGVQIPFLRIVSQPNSVETIQIEEVQQNLPIDNKKFEKKFADAMSSR